MSQGAVDLFQQLAQNDFGFFQKLQSVESLMTRELQTLTLDHTLGDAEDLFRRGPFRHVPIVEDGKVYGIVSERDVLRHRPPLLGTAAEGDGDHRALQTPLAEVMSRGLATVPSSASPDAALSLMLERHIDSVLVHDDRKQLCGIVTPSDFMKMILLFHRVCTESPELVRLRLVDLDMSRGLPLDLLFSRGARSVRDVMNKDYVSVSEGEAVAVAMETMQSLAVRHLPVVNARGKLVGLLSDREVLQALPLPVPRQDPKWTERRFRERLFATQDRQAPSGTAQLWATKDPTTIRPDALFVDAISLMMKQRLSALPVIESDSDRLCGMLTKTDVLRVFRVTMQIGSLLERSAGA